MLVINDSFFFNMELIWTKLEKICGFGVCFCISKSQAESSIGVPVQFERRGGIQCGVTSPNHAFFIVGPTAQSVDGNHFTGIFVGCEEGF